MKYIKSPKEYISGIDQLPIVGDADSVEIRSRYVEIKNKFNDFVDKMKNENDKTKKAFDLLFKASRGELLDDNNEKRDLTPEEKEQIREQAVNVLKMIGLTSITILPGGTLVFLLLKLFKQQDIILPSSFKRNKKDQ